MDTDKVVPSRCNTLTNTAVCLARVSLFLLFITLCLFVYFCIGYKVHVHVLVLTTKCVPLLELVTSVLETSLET